MHSCWKFTIFLIWGMHLIATLRSISNYAKIQSQKGWFESYFPKVFFQFCFWDQIFVEVYPFIVDRIQEFPISYRLGPCNCVFDEVFVQIRSLPNHFSRSCPAAPVELAWMLQDVNMRAWTKEWELLLVLVPMSLINFTDFLSLNSELNSVHWFKSVIKDWQLSSWPKAKQQDVGWGICPF